ncbi:3',5'-cyclic adenosine monophosphate phosphodiesterase CpdA [uncultured archaeon]|nr:3',5'-cyclic adenosine monophosphate phosphodiesterase CpdA [uncultured archaeon]
MSEMRILAFSDIHADEDALDRLRVLASRDIYDLVIFAGDMTNRGPISYAQDLIELFGERFYFVHGNMDSSAVVDSLRANPHYLHGRKLPLGEWNLVGLGGSNPTPFQTPSELGETQIEHILKSVGLDERSILVSHPPPYGSFDQVGGMHVGSKAVAAAIEQFHPLLVLCGHIHEHEGQQITGNTLVVKLGAANARRAADIKLGDEIDVSFISF